MGMGHAMKANLPFFHILKYESLTLWCMTIMNVSNENLFLALQNEASLVMSINIINEIGLHKEGHYQKHFRERTRLIFGVKVWNLIGRVILHNNILHFPTLTDFLTPNGWEES